MYISKYIYMNCSSVVGHREIDNSIIPKTTFFTVKAFLSSLLLSVLDIRLTFIGLITSRLERRPSVSDDRGHVPNPISKRRSVSIH
jgi:hypothetical protein